MMKKSIILALISFAFLSACVVALPNNEEGIFSTPSSPPVTVNQSTPYRLASSHWADLAKIKSEAERIALMIAAGTITKIEAARMLNKYRLELVGSNMVDDSIYQVYFNAAVDSSEGRISNTQSKNLVKSSLKGWQDRWKKMSDSEKPRNPAFTNFLNETMGLPYLK